MPIRFKVQDDILLMREVLAKGQWPDSAAEWEQIGKTISKEDFTVSSRCARERALLLVKTFKSEDNKKIKRSGEEETVDEFSVVLEESYQIYQESLRKLEDLKKQREKKSNESEDAKKLRQQALERMKKKSPVKLSNSQSSPKKAERGQKRRSSSGLADFMQEYMKTKLEFEKEKWETEKREREAQIEKDKLMLQLLAEKHNA